MGNFCRYGKMQADLHTVISLCKRLVRRKMEINHPPQPTEYEQLPAEKEESLIDRILIRIGDIVIQNFTFLVFITVVWGLFIVLFFGGIALVYTVSQRFIEIVAHEQQQQIIHEQHLEHMQAPITRSNNEIVGKPDESEWFLVLSDTAEQTSNLFTQEPDAELAEENLQPTAIKTAFVNVNHHKQELIIANQSWQVSCGKSGLILNASYPCLITQIEPTPSDLTNQDIAASN